MNLTLQALNEDASLNNFQVIGSAQVVRGASAKLILQMVQTSRKIRYIPDVAAVITMVLMNSDATTITKTASVPFADDRSIMQIDLSAAETASLIGQNLIATIVEGGNTSIAVLQLGLQMISPTQEGC